MNRRLLLLAILLAAALVGCVRTIDLDPTPADSRIPDAPPPFPDSAVGGPDAAPLPDAGGAPDADTTPDA